MWELRSSEFKLTFIPASALLAMRSSYIQLRLGPAAAPLIMHMPVCLGGVAIVCDYPHPALTLSLRGECDRSLKYQSKSLWPPETLVKLKTTSTRHLLSYFWQISFLVNFRMVKLYSDLDVKWKFSVQWPNRHISLTISCMLIKN